MPTYEPHFDRTSYPRAGRQQQSSGTYIVKDPGSRKELERVRIQSEMVTTGMGGPLSEQADPTIFKRVIDIGCGVGDWLFTLAETCPTMTTLVGIDINKLMINRAKATGATLPYGERLKFVVQDALAEKLPFPDASFDLVNMRFGSSFLRSFDWVPVLYQFQRICQPGGVIRIVEGEVVEESSSPALLRLTQIFLDASRKSMHTFSDESNGVTKELPGFLREQGIREVQTRSYALEFRAGTRELEAFYDDISKAMSTFNKYMGKFAGLPSDYEQLCKQALKEMRQPNFVAVWKLMTIWGTSHYVRYDRER